jgi:hypothetical protein
VQNYFSLETEAAHRRLEWQRAIAATEHRDQVRPEHGQTRWSQLASLLFPTLRSFATLRLPLRSWNPAGVQCARTLEGGGATVS